jgi:hypothetical protein
VRSKPRSKNPARPVCCQRAAQSARHRQHSDERLPVLRHGLTSAGGRRRCRADDMRVERHCISHGSISRPVSASGSTSGWRDQVNTLANSDRPAVSPNREPPGHPGPRDTARLRQPPRSCCPRACQLLAASSIRAMTPGAVWSLSAILTGFDGRRPHIVLRSAFRYSSRSVGGV